MTRLDRAVLRSVLGEDGYREMEAVGTLLDRIASRGLISREGLSTVLEHLAEEIVAQAVANDVGKDLSTAPGSADTPATEARS